jgi:hypothetical protein
VRRHRRTEVACDLEGGALGELGVTGHVEGHLEAQHVAAVEAPVDERAELWRRGPLPRAGLDVAVGQDEPPGHGFEGVDRGLGVVGGLQSV